MNYEMSGRGNSDETTRHKDKFSMGSGYMIKIFRCSFCERGFSNAQALGGHMNIHRKDRAKLKEFANVLSLDITKTVDLVGEDSPVDPSTSEEAANSNDDDIKDLVPKSVQIQSVRSLSLFAAAAAAGDDEKNSTKCRIHGGVDLELRLGHDANINH